VTVCSPPNVWVLISAWPSVRAKTGVWRLMMRIALIARRNILVKSCFESLMVIGFRSLPQAIQKCCLFSGFWLRWLQDAFFGFVVKRWILKIFSDKVSKMMDPKEMRAQPPSRWNVCVAVSIPYWLPISTVMVIRIMLRANIRGIPARKTVAFFQGVPLAMYAIKTAKIVNPIREYMPAHAGSTVKVRGKA